jgi:hypothetical protein
LDVLCDAIRIKDKISQSEFVQQKENSKLSQCQIPSSFASDMNPMTPLSSLEAVLKASPEAQGNLRILGQSFQSNEPKLLDFVLQLKQSEEFADDWPELLKAMKQGIEDPLGPMADARMMALFSHYLVTVRKIAESGELLPRNMMTWVGKGEDRFPAESTIWFLLETEGFGSEAVRDVVNVLGGETTFLTYFFSDASNEVLLEQAGYYLTMLLHLREKWSAYYDWMLMDPRMQQMRILFLEGSEALPILEKRGPKVIMPQVMLDVYDILSRTMYQFEFYLLLREYVAALKATKCLVTPQVNAIREKMFAL